MGLLTAGVHEGRSAEEPQGPIDQELRSEPEEISIPFTWQDAYRKTEKAKSYSKGPNVHRSPSHCDYCHEKGKKPTADDLLFNGQDIPLCRSCHPRSVYQLHVVDIRPEKVKVPKEFPLPGGKITCVTCHDEPSCNPKDSPSWKRPFFLRGKKEGFMFCFECHVPAGYKPYNPHDPEHLKNPVERTNNCLFCHLAEIPADSRRGVAFASLKGNPNDLCSACHLEEPHFGIPAHLNHKRKMFLDQLAKAAKTEGPWLPLGKNDEVYCVSCHDPHMPGLIPARKEGPDSWLEPEPSKFEEQYREKDLHPFVKDRLEELETVYGRVLIIREPGLFHEKRKKLLRRGLQKDGSLCLRCHDVFEEDKEQEKERSLDYRVLY